MIYKNDLTIKDLIPTKIVRITIPRTISILIKFAPITVPIDEPHIFDSVFHREWLRIGGWLDSIRFFNTYRTYVPTIMLKDYIKYKATLG